MADKVEMTPEEAHAEAVRRVAHARAAGVKHLDLGDLPLVRLPDELTVLDQLEILVAGNNRLQVQADGTSKWHFEGQRPYRYLVDIGSLSALTQLHTIDLRYQTKLVDVRPLAALTGLHTLNLGRTGVTDAAPLATLTGLHTLNLRSTGVTNTAPLAALTRLHTLYLGNTGVTDVAPLAALTGLHTLGLRNTGVTNAAPLAALTRLHTLKLGSTGVTDVSPLAALTGLHTLDLGGCTGLTDVSPLAALTGLHTLDLGGCTGLTDVSPLAALTGLHTLDLGGCTGLTDVSPLAALTGLHTLDLRGCEKLAFEPLRPLRASLQELFLKDAKFTDLPQEVCGKEYCENVLDQVWAYYDDLDDGTQTDAEVKLFVLGNGGVGKTQLRRRLCGRDFDSSIPTTHGVELDQFAAELDGLRHEVHVNLWDFGGQDIYHGSHALFLDGHAVFVVLCHPDFEDGAFVQGGVAMANRPLAYWLDYVRAAAGPDAVVLVVQARGDQRGDEHLLPPGTDFGGLRVRTLAVSALTGRGLDVLQAELRLAVRDLLDARPPFQIGVGRAKVRDRLRAMRPPTRNATRPTASTARCRERSSRTCVPRPAG